MTIPANLDELAAAARPIDEDDWGSERQIAAQNLFMTVATTAMGREWDEKFHDWCFKASVDEMIDRALLIVRALDAGFDVLEDHREPRQKLYHVTRGGQIARTCYSDWEAWEVIERMITHKIPEDGL
jgi:hypothetical protein